MEWHNSLQFLCFSSKFLSSLQNWYFCIVCLWKNAIKWYLGIPFNSFYNTSWLCFNILLHQCVIAKYRKVYFKKIGKFSTMFSLCRYSDYRRKTQIRRKKKTIEKVSRKKKRLFIFWDEITLAVLLFEEKEKTFICKMNIFEIKNLTNLELSPIKLGRYTPLDSEASHNFISVHESLETYSEIRKNIFCVVICLSVHPHPHTSCAHQDMWQQFEAVFLINITTDNVLGII